MTKYNLHLEDVNSMGGLGTPKQWLRFVNTGKSKSGKTDIYEVRHFEDDELLGHIRWHGAWRQYVFEPVDNTIWSHGCSLELANFLKIITSGHNHTEQKD